LFLLAFALVSFNIVLLLETMAHVEIVILHDVKVKKNNEK